MPKIRKQYQKGFTTLDNTPLNDESLSWKAKGLFAYLWSKPDDWDYRVTEVARHATDGIGSTSTGVNELEQAGYLKRKQKNKNGVFGDSVWTLSEQPIFKNPLTENPSSDNALTEEPYTENRKLLNTDLLNTDLLNTNSTNKRTSTNNTSAGTQSASSENPFDLIHEYHINANEGDHLSVFLNAINQLGEPLVCWAIRQTADGPAPHSWSYLKKVFNRLKADNISSVEEANKRAEEHKRGKNSGSITKSRKKRIYD